jgi:hypothetical protein
MSCRLGSDTEQLNSSTAVRRLRRELVVHPLLAGDGHFP